MYYTGFKIGQLLLEYECDVKNNYLNTFYRKFDFFIWSCNFN